MIPLTGRGRCHLTEADVASYYVFSYDYATSLIKSAKPVSKE